MFYSTTLYFVFSCHSFGFKPTNTTTITHPLFSLLLFCFLPAHGKQLKDSYTAKKPKKLCDNNYINIKLFRTKEEIILTNTSIYIFGHSVRWS